MEANSIRIFQSQNEEEVPKKMEVVISKHASSSLRATTAYAREYPFHHFFNLTFNPSILLIDQNKVDRDNLKALNTA